MKEKKEEDDDDNEENKHNLIQQNRIKLSFKEKHVKTRRLVGKEVSESLRRAGHEFGDKILYS